MDVLIWDGPAISPDTPIKKQLRFFYIRIHSKMIFLYRMGAKFEALDINMRDIKELLDAYRDATE